MVGFAGEVVRLVAGRVPAFRRCQRVEKARRLRPEARAQSTPALVGRPLLLAVILATTAHTAAAETQALQDVRQVTRNQLSDGGMGFAFAYCAWHAPTFDNVLADAAADGMDVFDQGNGGYAILAPDVFRDARIQVKPLGNDGKSSCVAWSGSARGTDADTLADDAVGQFLSGGRPEKVSASPSDYVFHDLPFEARLRAFEFQGGHGVTFDFSGLTREEASLLRVVRPEPPAKTWPRTVAEAAPKGSGYEYEFMFGSGCVIWLPDLKSAMIAVERAGIPMAKNAETYYYVGDFGTNLALTEGTPGKITSCRVFNAIPMATANKIVRRVLALGNMSFEETPEADGGARWVGVLAPRKPGDKPRKFTARTYLEPDQTLVTVDLRLDQEVGQ